MATVERIPLQVDSYGDSGFTDAHDVVSLAPIHDGRGLFTHLGVRMEGLESARHLAFRASQSGDRGLRFGRDPTQWNELVLSLAPQAFTPARVARLNRLEFHTTHYTNNHVQILRRVQCLYHNRVTAEWTDVALEGDSVRLLAAKELHAAPRMDQLRIWMGEGGLARLWAYGSWEEADAQAMWSRNLLLDAKQLQPVAHIWGASDASYGDPQLVLRARREGKTMAGWETRRHSARHWLGLGWPAPVKVRSIEIDTYLHRLNAFPYIYVLGASLPATVDESRLSDTLPTWTVSRGSDDGGCRVPDKDLNSLVADWERQECATASPRLVEYSLNTATGEGNGWQVLLGPAALRPDTRHQFDVGAGDTVSVTHLVLIGVPDGGLHRIGVYGLPESAG